MRRPLTLLIPGMLTLAPGYLALLAAPYPLFAYSASYANIKVYSDHPIAEAIQPLLIIWGGIFAIAAVEA